MSLADYRFDGEEKLELRGANTGGKKDWCGQRRISSGALKKSGAHRGAAGQAVCGWTGVRAHHSAGYGCRRQGQHCQACDGLRELPRE